MSWRLAAVFSAPVFLLTAHVMHAAPVFTQSDWSTEGVAVEPGSPGSWDVRLTGVISPIGIVRKGGVYYLYYIGADGDRSSDGGPRNRALGVATSGDGINFTKHAGNPILTFQPHGNEEEGIFSGTVTLDENGNFILYYGAMDAGNSTSTSVSGDVRLATSGDGLSFSDRGIVLSHSDGSVWGHGDEIYPVGIYEHNGQWHLHYIAASGSEPNWSLGLASGPSRDNFTNTRGLIVGGRDVIGGGDPQRLDSSTGVLFLVRDFADNEIEARPFPLDDPDSLGAPAQTYNFSGYRHVTILLDQPQNRWLMYQRQNSTGQIVVRSALVKSISSDNDDPMSTDASD